MAVSFVDTFLGRLTKELLISDTYREEVVNTYWGDVLLP
jgi:hypothetical protein